jgi:hypothetical protein
MESGQSILCVAFLPFSDICHVKIKNDDIMSFVTDATKFVAAFSSPISQSTPHIYLSALPFAPKKSQVAQHFLP